MNCPALAGTRHVKLALAPEADALPPMETIEPEAPPLHVTSSPAERVTAAAAPWFVQVIRGVGNTTVTPKLPTSTPPPPLNVKLPPEAGMKPASSWAP